MNKYITEFIATFFLVPPTGHGPVADRQNSINHEITGNSATVGS